MLDGASLQIDNHVSLAAWAWAVGIIFGGAVGAGIDAAIGGYIQRQAYTKTRNAVVKAVDAFNAPSLSATLGTLADVAISPQGISIAFSKDLPASAAIPVSFPSLYVSQSAQRTVGPLGPDRSETFNNPCMHGTYHYREQDVMTTVTFVAQATQLDAPIQYTWMVGYGVVSGSGVLTGDDGTRLHYAVSADGAGLTLSNERGQAPFRAEVGCRAVDPDGLRAEAPPILALFEGTQRIWEDRYRKDLSQCVRGAMKSIGRGPTMEPPGSQPGIGPVSLGQLIDGGDPVGLRQLATLSQAAGPMGRGLLEVAQAVRTFGRARQV